MTTQTAAPASTATAGGDPSAAVHARRWVILALLAGCLALIALDNTIVNVALPRMQEDLHVSEGELQWIVDSYSLFFAGSLLIAGSLGDRYGRRLALLFGLSVFGLFSLGAGLAPNTDTLMICRALMGIGGAFIMPPTLSILAQVFRDPGERGQAIAIWAAVAGAAVAVGPVLGGFLLEHFDWHSIFLINPVLVIGAIAVTLAVVPESRNPARPRLDPLGATLSTTGLVSLIYAIIQIPEDGLSLGTVGAGLVGIALLVGFVVWELRAPSPMLDMNFFADSLFSTSVFAVAVIYFALFGAMFFVPQFLQLVRGFSPLASGFGVVPLAAGLLVASLLSTRWAAHVGARTVVVTGLLSVTAGMVVAAFITASTPYVVLGIVLALMGAGLGLALPQGTNGIIASVPREKAGSGAAVNDAVGEIGGSLGVAILGAILSTSYHSSINTAIARAGPAAAELPHATLDSIRESLASASVAAGQIEGPAGPAIRATAGVAFTNGMTTALLIGAIVPAVGAIVVRWKFPASSRSSRNPDWSGQASTGSKIVPRLVARPGGAGWDRTIDRGMMSRSRFGAPRRRLCWGGTATAPRRSLMPHGKGTRIAMQSVVRDPVASGGVDLPPRDRRAVRLCGDAGARSSAARLRAIRTQKLVPAGACTPGDGDDW